MNIAHLHDLPSEPVSHNGVIGKQVMLRAGVLTSILQMARAVFPAGAEVAAHIHRDMDEVFWVESGLGVIEIEGERFPMQPQMMVAVAAGEAHAIVNDGDEPLVLLYFGCKA
ncbi:MAG: cupin domain-containing protein [Zetaproteobacteria bacterium]|nr:cupin domain-containing protein [Zetaproteobacteria bacterium]